MAICKTFHEYEGHLISPCKPNSLAPRSYATALKSRFNRVTAPGSHSSSGDRLGFENLMDADVKALQMHKENEDHLAERRGCIDEKNEQKRAVAATSDFVPPLHLLLLLVTALLLLEALFGGGKKGKPLPPGASGGMQDAIDILGTHHNHQQNQNNVSNIMDIMLENKHIKEMTTNTTSVIAAQFKDKYQTLPELKTAFDKGCFTDAEYATRLQDKRKAQIRRRSHDEAARLALLYHLVCLHYQQSALQLEPSITHHFHDTWAMKKADAAADAQVLLRSHNASSAWYYFCHPRVICNRVV
eukprot:scaffold41963_cov67-Attheya_sp.AAC.2